MKRNIIEKFRGILEIHKKTLLDWINAGTRHEIIQCCGVDSGYNPTTQDLQVIAKIDDTMDKIEKGEFGRCKVCDGEVEAERMELDYTTEVCLDHYSETEMRALERDLEMAGKIQRQLLPSKIPDIEGFHISAHTKSAGIVGGDYFDFYNGKENSQGIVIADVMGKGLPASMLMSNLQASLRILGPEYDDLSDLAFRVNELFRYNTKLISFISMFFARLNGTNGNLQYCNAGHNPPLLWKADSKKIEWLKPTGPAIGLMHQAFYKTEEIYFESGDLLIIYTDGLVESRNKNNDEFGGHRLEKLVENNYQKNSAEFVSILNENVNNFSEGGIKDDMTFIIIQRQ